MAQYNIGSVTVTNGSPVITGVSTLFLANINISDAFSIFNSGVYYSVAAVDSDTQITLSANYAGATATAQAYTITRDFTPILGLPYPVTGDVDTAGIVKRAFLMLDQGVVVTGLNWRGAYTAATPYSVDDAVQHLGSAFVCIAQGTGITPPTGAPWNNAHWDLLVSTTTAAQASAVSAAASESLAAASATTAQTAETNTLAAWNNIDAQVTIPIIQMAAALISTQTIVVQQHPAV